NMKWQLDPMHTSVTFQVRHMSFFTITGSFSGVSGSVETNDQNFPTHILIEIDVNTISTNSDPRDTHLKSAEFFDAAKFPKLIFSSNQIQAKPVAYNLIDLLTGKRNPVKYIARGQLNMHGISQTIDLEFEIPSPPVKDLWQATRIGAIGETVIDRTKWGMNWNQAVPSLNNALLVSHAVKISFSTQLTLV
ncbi:MAG: hypothetical protein RLZZ156_1746, partial [Deinococcota bacterium]